MLFFALTLIASCMATNMGDRSKCQAMDEAQCNAANSCGFVDGKCDGCHVPPGWCTFPNAITVYRDCGDDGLPESYCEMKGVFAMWLQSNGNCNVATWDFGTNGIFDEKCPVTASCSTYTCQEGSKSKGEGTCAGSPCVAEKDQETCCESTGPALAKTCDQKVGEEECLENKLETCCVFKKGECSLNTKCDKCAVGSTNPAGCEDNDPVGCNLLSGDKLKQVCGDQSPFADVFRRECPKKCNLCNECQGGDLVNSAKAVGHSLTKFPGVGSLCECNALCGAHKLSNNIPYKMVFNWDHKKKGCECFIGVHSWITGKQAKTFQAGNIY